MKILTDQPPSRLRLWSILQIAILAILSLFFLVGAFITYKQQNSSEINLEFLNGAPEQNKIFKKLAFISGAVRNPGVYEITDETRINELIQLAGGFTKDADKTFLNESLNLAAKVKDEQMIYIPTTKENNSNTNTSVKGEATDLININSASMEELDTLPGIGPATAKKIIDNRPYENIQDILNVSGIGDSKFEQIKDLIKV